MTIFIDHPNLGDVYKTTYEKGKITDFNVVSEDPFKVSAMVKVSGSWGESDFIPIFFCPKEKYWDTADHSATAFNQDGKYYENAWMSFRKDDEVQVVLSEDKPKIVIGHYDGLPRIGENIIKMASDDLFIKLDDFSRYMDEDTGPDGLNLKLVQQAEKVENEEEDSEESGLWYKAVSASANESPAFSDIAYYEKTGDTSYRLSLWPIKVGPLLVAFFYFVKIAGEQVWDYYYGSWSAYYPEIRTWYDETVAKPGSLTRTPPPYFGTKNPGLCYTVDPVTKISQVCIKIGLYSDKLLDDTIRFVQSCSPVEIDRAYGVDNYYAVGADFVPDAPEDLKYQETITTTFKNIVNYYHIEPDSEFFYRPHTKEELQAAGMWPL